MSDFELPNTRYALSGDVNIAFQVMGDGPIDIILVPGIVSHVEFLHELPEYTRFLRRLATFARVVTFDKRGQGLSDGISGAPSLEQRVDDVRAIMDDIGSQRAVLLGISEGSPMSAFFAAANPEACRSSFFSAASPRRFRQKGRYRERWKCGARAL
jgi:pimeloyl-ACP methyl ester carboxylesterase